MTEAAWFFVGVTIGTLGGAVAMGLTYFHFIGDKTAEEEEVEVRQNFDRAPRELNRISKMHNVIVIDGAQKRRNQA